VYLLEPIAIDSSFENIDAIEDIIEIGILEREASAFHVREVVVSIPRIAVREDRGDDPVE
jgi:hypothetical protein